MIGYLEGKILKKEEDRILVLANQIGYEVLLPAIVMASFQDNQIGDEISLYIFYQQTERQPKPILIGFNLEVEKEFFQYFISVSSTIHPPEPDPWLYSGDKSTRRDSSR